MTAETEALVSELLGEINQFTSSHADGPLTEVQEQSQLFLTWIGYLQASVSNDVCDELLSAIRSSLIEVAACCTIGLVRPALFSIRLQIELFLSWLYFNDHVVEWRHVKNEDGDFPMRKRNLQYLTAHMKEFGGKLATLRSTSSYKGPDPYQLLSAYVHGTSSATLPSSENLKSVVESKDLVDDCINLQGATAEYLSDLATVWLSSRWDDFPPVIQNSIKQRLSPAQLKALCS